VDAFDSTTIDFFLSVLWWATFRTAKGRIKLHSLFGITTQIPAFIHITPATVNDMKAMDYLIYEPSAYYILDRSYVAFVRLHRITSFSAFFVICGTTNLKFNRMYSRKVDKTSNVKYDQITKLTGFYVFQDYPDKLRRVKFFDEETGRTFVFSPITST
jgi:hypothetical protein